MPCDQIRPEDNLSRFLCATQAELRRSVAKFGWQLGLPLDAWLSILTEEVGEVARLLNEVRLGNHPGGDGLVTELVQVAAMAAKMSLIAEKRSELGWGWFDNFSPIGRGTSPAFEGKFDNGINEAKGE